MATGPRGGAQRRRVGWRRVRRRGSAASRVGQDPRSVVGSGGGEEKTAVQRRARLVLAAVESGGGGAGAREVGEGRGAEAGSARLLRLD